MPAMSTPTQDDLVEADRAGEVVNTSKCHTGTMIAGLPVNAQATVILALTSDHVRTSDVVDVFRAHGLPARAENVNRHRRRLTGTGKYTCKCARLEKAAT